MIYPEYQARSAKELYFFGEPSYGIKPEWSKEKDLVNCQDCGFHYDCPHKNRPERFPADAGGGGQCLRLAQYLSPYSFQNVDGKIIVIPEQVVDAIRRRSEDE